VAQRVQLIYADNPGSLPASYQLPAGLDLVLSSVRAKINGAGASGPFLPCLSIYSQDDKLMARVPTDTEYAVGDTGEVTWAPFLRKRAAAAAGGGTIPGFHAWLAHSVTVPTGNNQRMEWDSWTIDGGTTYFQEGALSAGRLTEVKLMLAGWYAIECWAAWSSEPASGPAAIACVDDDTDVAEPRKAQGITYPINMSSAPALAFEQVRYYPADFTEVQTFGWVNRLEFWVVQNSGVNRTMNEGYCNIAYLGARLT